MYTIFNFLAAGIIRYEVSVHIMSYYIIVYYSYNYSYSYIIVENISFFCCLTTYVCKQRKNEIFSTII